MAYFLLILSAICSILASIMLKIGSDSLDISSISFLLSKKILYHIAAIGFYGLGFVLYAFSLKKLDLSLAYPLMVSIAIAGVIFYSIFFGNETVTSWRIIGSLFIAIGIFMLN